MIADTNSSRLPVKRRAHEPTPISLSSMVSSKSPLQHFLSQNALDAELEDLERKSNLFQSPSELQPLDVSSFFTAISQLHEENNIISALPPGPWTDDKANMAFGQLETSVAFLLILIRESAKLDIIVRSLRWEAIRAYLTIYHWYDDAGPSLADVLFDAHRDGVLEDKHPQFAGLVDHIMQYIGSVVQAKSNPECNLRSPARLRSLPEGLYGLDLPVKGKGNLQLPVVHPSSVGKKKETQYVVAARCFLDFISQHIIISGVSAFDKKLTTDDPKKSHTPEYIKARLVICGATISRIVKVFGNDDSILACMAVHELILDPQKLFHMSGLKANTLSQRILQDPDGVFSQFDKFLKDRLLQSPGLRDAARRITDIVWGRLMDLTAIKRTGTRRPTGFFAPVVKRGSETNTPKGRADPKISASTLTKKDTTVSYGAVGLLIREVLAKRRGLPECNQFVRRIMNQLPPTTGSVIGSNSRDIDHFNPVRYDNENTKIFIRSLPAEKLTTREGGSAFTVWMCTGQGNMTRDFVAGKNMVFSDLEACVATFSNASSRGETCTNTKIWGKSPCSWMALEVDKKFTIREKFTPMYTKAFQDSWITFLGNLAGRNPNTYTGRLHPWWDMIEWIMSLDINCLKKYSLTVLQMANNAALQRICLPPTKFEMGRFLSESSTSSVGDKGTIKGLELCGFGLSNRKNRSQWISSAFVALYDHLDAHLSDADKTELDFGAMFSEHMLCKTGRFESIFHNDKNTKSVTLGSLGRAAEKEIGESWVEGANIRDGMKFPIPLSADSDELDVSIQTAMVGTLSYIQVASELMKFYKAFFDEHE
jgi:hypothetical protein